MVKEQLGCSSLGTLKMASFEGCNGPLVDTCGLRLIGLMGRDVLLMFRFASCPLGPGCRGWVTCGSVERVEGLLAAGSFEELVM